GAAEDLLRVDVDSDDQDPAGYPTAGISADRLVEARGRNGRVLATAVYAWNETAWAWDARPGAVLMDTVGARLEASVPAASLGPLRNPRVVYAMTDWSLRGDLSDVPTGSRGVILEGGPNPLHAGTPDEVKPTPRDNTPTIDGDCASRSGWGSSCGACDSGDAGASRYSTYEWYEFKIRYTDVWGTLSPSADQVAGFAIVAYDFNTGTLRTWGGEAVNQNVPNTWGHVI